jgi:hypothetical protein
MMPSGEFVPDAGSIVIRFREYDPRGSLGIWNLPGFFMRKEKLEELRKHLAGPAGTDPALAAEKALLAGALEWKKLSANAKSTNFGPV